MNLDDLVRPNIKKLKPYTSARSTNLTGILLDANENPYDQEIAGLTELKLNRYPDPNQTEVRLLLSEYLNVPSSNLFVGVGSDEIIDLLIRIFCEPGKDKCLIPEPTYGMYKVACDINNVETIKCDLDKNFDISIENISQYYNFAKIIFLCSPNNPTGNLLSIEKVESILNNFSGLVILDEAYVDFCESGSMYRLADKYPNIIILRTFSKAWGLAGVRCGYAIADSTVINYLFKVKAPYNLNKLTEDIVKKSLRNKEIKNKFVEAILTERDHLLNGLKSIKGIKNIYHSDANFILFQCEDASEVQKKLNQNGIVIRDRSTQRNLHNCLRVSVGTPFENERFLEEIGKIL